MNTDIRDYTICGLVDPETQRIMFVFMTVGESTQRVIHHNAHPTEEWEEKTGLGGTAKRDWIQSLTDRGLEAEWVVLERVRADAAGARAAKKRHIVEQAARNPDLTNTRYNPKGYCAHISTRATLLV